MSTGGQFLWGVFMARILCSTGALIGRPNGRDYRLLESLSENLECDGFEFMMYSDWYEKIEDIVTMVRRLRLSIPSYHVQKSIGENISKGGPEEIKDAFERFKINCDMAARMGAEKIVCHLWDGLTSDLHFENNIKAYPELLKMSEAAGVDLLVENVVCNNKDPFTRWMELLSYYPDIHFIFDTKMAAFHEQLDLIYKDENAFLWKEGHIRHYHVNDYGGGYMDWANLRTLPIGKGHIDFEKFFDFIKRIGYDDTFTLESTAFDSTGYVDTDMLNEEVRYIREMI